MQDHPTVSQLTLFCARALALSELTAIAEHLTVCLACQRDLREIFQQHRDNKPIAFSLAEAEWFRDAHLDYEQLSALADGELDKADAAIQARRMVRDEQRHDRGIPLTLFQSADVLLTKARFFSKLLLGHPKSLTRPANISANQCPHIHAGRSADYIL